MTLVSHLRTRLLVVLAAVALALSLTAAMTPPRAHAACGVAYNFHGKVGHRLCGTTMQRVTFTDGTQRAVLIGLDSAVWNIVYYPSTGYVSPWASLGGTLHKGIGFNTSRNSAYFRIVSTDQRPWCKRYVRQGGTGWGPWYHCDG